MKLKEVKRIMSGRNHLDCLVLLERFGNDVWFTDNTKGTCYKVTTQEQLDVILKNNKF